MTQKLYQGYTFTYAYDSRDRLTGVTGSGVSSGYVYDPNTGNLASVSNGGGVSASYQYYRNNAVKKITNTTGSGSTAWDYTYDGAGRVKTVATLGGQTTYTYDKAGRVETVAMPGKTLGYTYDDAGNRMSMTEEPASAKEHQDAVTGQTVSYNGKTTYYAYSDANELETTTAVMYNEGVERLRLVTTNSYDTDGRLYCAVTASVLAGELQSGLAVTDGANAAVDMTQNSYDVWGNLTAVSVVKGGQTSSTGYAYNGDGLRTSRTVTGADGVVKTTNYLLDGAYVVGETDGAGAVTATYVRGMSYIAKIGAASGTSYYQYNAHGDVVAVASGTDGHVQNRYEYDIFGMEILNGVEEVENSIRYAGEFYDASAGLYYLRARYYDPATARFTSEDTYRGDVTDPASLNLYTYCGNDPVNYTDPTGHDYWDVNDFLPGESWWGYDPADYGGHPGVDILPGESPYDWGLGSPGSGYDEGSSGSGYDPADYGGHPGVDILPGESPYDWGLGSPGSGYDEGSSGSGYNPADYGGHPGVDILPGESPYDWGLSRLDASAVKADEVGGEGSGITSRNDADPDELGRAKTIYNPTSPFYLGFTNEYYLGLLGYTPKKIAQTLYDPGSPYYIGFTNEDSLKLLGYTDQQIRNLKANGVEVLSGSEILAIGGLPGDEEYGEDSVKYKMLATLGEAWLKADTSRERDIIHAQAEALRAFDDNNFNRAILLNNETGANISTNVKGVTVGGNAGHNAVLIMNSSDEGLFFSFYPETDGEPYDDGEMRFAVLSRDETNQLLYGNGAVSNAVTNFGEVENESYNRFVYFGTTNGEGYNMYNEAVSLFDNPGYYSGTGRQCDNITEQILSAGGKWYFENNTPNLSYDDLIKEHPHWTNNR